MQDELIPADVVHHEDFEIGRPIALGHKTVTREEIIAFASQFDPQPMHLDEEAARKTIVGGLCASGFHTCAMMMRMICDGLLLRTASLGSPGLDEVKWLLPVRPQDRVSATYTPLEKRVLASRPGVGITKVLVELRNAKGEVVATWITNQMTRLRHPGVVAPADGGAKRDRKPIASLWDAPGSSAPPLLHGFFEDREIGETVDLQPVTFSKDEIIAFASQFDPQPFHLDEEAGRRSLFGGLCASGWHTAAIFIREVVRARQLSAAEARARGERVAVFGPSPGFRNLKWPRPIHAGDKVEFRARVMEKIDLRSRPDRGLIVSEVEGRNQRGEIVYGITTQGFLDRREAYRPAS